MQQRRADNIRAWPRNSAYVIYAAQCAILLSQGLDIPSGNQASKEFGGIKGLDAFFSERHVVSSIIFFAVSVALATSALDLWPGAFQPAYQKVGGSFLFHHLQIRWSTFGTEGPDIELFHVSA